MTIEGKKNVYHHSCWGIIDDFDAWDFQRPLSIEEVEALNKPRELVQLEIKSILEVRKICDSLLSGYVEGSWGL